MKLRSLFFGTLCMLMLGVSFTSCSDDDDDSKKNDEGSKVELPENRVYILNEGSYQKNNAGITYYDPDKRNNVIDDIFYKQNLYSYFLSFFLTSGFSSLLSILDSMAFKLDTDILLKACSMNCLCLS